MNNALRAAIGRACGMLAAIGMTWIIAGAAYAQTWVRTPDLPGPPQTVQDLQTLGIDGGFIAVWMATENGQIALRASRHAAGAWSTPPTLTLPGNAGELQIAPYQDGVLAVWSLGYSHYWSARYSPSSGWNAPQFIASRTSGSGDIVLSHNQLGAITAVWSAYDSVSSLASADYVNGAWTAAGSISGEGSTSMSLVLDSAGVATLVWHRGASVSARVQASRRVGGVWSTPVVLATGRNAGWVDTAVDETGVVSAAWQSFTGGARAIEVARFANGAWSPYSVLATYGAGVIVGASAPGTFHFAWGDNSVMTYSGRDEINGALTAERAVPFPTIAIHGHNSGTALVLSTDVWGPTADVQYISRFVDGQWEAPVNATGGPATSSDLDLDTQGVGTFVWTGQDGIIRASRASVTAPPEPVPTLSEWAMILLGLTLAGGAALVIQRRRLEA